VQVHQLSDGAYIRTIGSSGSSNGQFRRGYGGYGGVAFDSEGNLVVADSFNHRVEVLRYSDGMHIRTIGSAGAGAGQFRFPTGVAFDAAGHNVVVEAGNNRVQVLCYIDGAHARTIGNSGSGNGEFDFPCGGIAIDSDGRIVVADTENHRVQVLECELPPAPPSLPPPICLLPKSVFAIACLHQLLQHLVRVSFLQNFVFPSRRLRAIKAGNKRR
jgi:hypothetical protein